MVHKKTFILSASFLTLIVALPLVLVSVSNKADVRSRASNERQSKNVTEDKDPGKNRASSQGCLHGEPDCLPNISTNPSARPTAKISQPPISQTEVSKGSLVIQIRLRLHGIGAEGDNVLSSRAGNQNPLHPQRTIEITAYDIANALIGTGNGTISYDKQSGEFFGTVQVPYKAHKGTLLFKLKTDYYLRRAVPGAFEIKPNTTLVFPTLSLIAGDIISDNVIDVADFNILMSCYSRRAACTTDWYRRSDLDDNGSVNQYDYNLFLREQATSHGD